MAAPSGPETAKVPEESVHICPGCGLPLTEQILTGTDFHCTQCGLEMAHVQTTALGAPRTVIRWLLSPGDLVLDRYKIEKVLGKGGFAATYLAQDLRVNGKKRALKEIPESLYDATETELLSHLSHPAIPDITDQSREGGMVYLVLELGGGRTLEAERRLAGGKVPYQQVLGWMMQLGAAISYLHSQDPPIIHRDLKPDNILLDDQGRVMLIDFGIAKQAVAGGQTRVIARAATHGFSPPEQAMGTGTDPRSDVYALAATAYALITGVIPTPAHERIAGKPLADPVGLVPDLPPRIAEALQQGLNLNLNQRPASVEQFMQVLGLALVAPGDLAATTRTVMVGDAATLASVAQATSVRIRSEHLTVGPSAPIVKAGPRVGVWVAAGLVVLALGAGGAWLLSRPSGPASAAAESRAASAVVQPAHSVPGPDVTVPSAGVVPPPVSGHGVPPQASAVTNATPTVRAPKASASSTSTGVGRVQPELSGVPPTARSEPMSTPAPPQSSALQILESERHEPSPPFPTAVRPSVEPKRAEVTTSLVPPPRPPPRKPPPRTSTGTSAKGWVFKKGPSFKTD